MCLRDLDERDFIWRFDFKLKPIFGTAPAPSKKSARFKVVKGDTMTADSLLFTKVKSPYVTHGKCIEIRHSLSKVAKLLFYGHFWSLQFSLDHFKIELSLSKSMIHTVVIWYNWSRLILSLWIHLLWSDVVGHSYNSKDIIAIRLVFSIIWRCKRIILSGFYWKYNFYGSTALK